MSSLLYVQGGPQARLPVVSIIRARGKDLSRGKHGLSCEAVLFAKLYFLEGRIRNLRLSLARLARSETRTSISDT